jgi:hypothetical protein
MHDVFKGCKMGSATGGNVHSSVCWFKYVDDILDIAMAKGHGTLFVLLSTGGGRIKKYDLSTNAGTDQGHLDIPGTHGDHLIAPTPSMFISWKSVNTGTNIWKFELCSGITGYSVYTHSNPDQCAKDCPVGKTWGGVGTDTCIDCPTNCNVCDPGTTTCRECAPVINCSGNNYINSSNACVSCNHLNCKAKAQGGCVNG